MLKAPRVEVDGQGSLGHGNRNTLLTQSLKVTKSLKAEFFIGFLSGFLNPKDAIFYLSLFTVMVSIDTSLFTRSLYALWMVFLVLFWDFGLAIMIGSHRVKQKLFHWIYAIEKGSGVILTMFGIGLIF